MTIAKLKSSHLWLSYTVVVSLPFESILSKISRYEADKSDSVASFISSSSGIWQMDTIVKIMIVDWLFVCMVEGHG
jgi:hypothetical protein